MKTKELNVAAQTSGDTSTNAPSEYIAPAMDSAPAENAYVHEYRSLMDCLMSNHTGILTECEMQLAIPVEVIDTESDIEAAAINWAAHARPYLNAFMWFKKLTEEYEYEFIATLFETFTVEEKTIVQRGFEIFQYDAYPPILDNELYVVDLEIIENPKTKFEFPVRRINVDSQSEAIRRLGLDTGNFKYQSEKLH